jgi:hypothetical protein
MLAFLGRKLKLKKALEEGYSRKKLLHFFTTRPQKGRIER